MPLFRRKTDPKLPKTSSLSVYGQGRIQALQNRKNSDSESVRSIDLEDRPPNPLAFAEAIFEPSVSVKTKSRLSKDLKEVLEDNNALACFIQFMDAKRAKHLVKFWLEAESFRASGTKHKSDENLSAPNSRSSGYISDDIFQPANKDMAQDCKKQLDSTPSVDGTTHTGAGESSVNNVLKSKLLSDKGNELSEATNDCRQEYDSLERELSGPKLDLPKEDFVLKLKTSIEQDARAIYSKYISPNASCSINLPVAIQISVEDELMKSGTIDSSCFVPAQEFVVKRMEVEYFPYFLCSSFHCKHQIDVLTSGTVYLADVLYNDSALFFFMEFMEQERVRHLVDFLLMADNFQKHLLQQENAYDGVQAQTDAMVIYDKYFSLQANVPLGFSDVVRIELETNICQEGGPDSQCFLKPVKILTQYMEKTFLQQFLSHQLFFKYISDCTVMIQNAGAHSDVYSKSVGSESGGSGESSSVNTLLAMDSKQPGVPKIPHSSLHIDPKMFEPDALWQRPLAGKLQMAHVDHLGRVTYEFEPSDPEKKESKISKAVKKLVNWEEDKNQEEMAWKVAEMIVRDVCSVTMPDCDPFQPPNSS